MTTQSHRNTPLFLRNGYRTDGQWGIPFVYDDPIITKEMLKNAKWIPCSSTRHDDTPANQKKCVHHFVGDEHLSKIFTYPYRTLRKYSQYALLTTPDYSAYREMPQALQIFSVFTSRWVGAFWQAHGLTVVPSVTWSDVCSFSYCFSGLEQGGVVAVSTVGCRAPFEGRPAFIRGFEALVAHVAPRLVLCIGTPFLEMYDIHTSILAWPYEYPKKGVR